MAGGVRSASSSHSEGGGFNLGSSFSQSGQYYDPRQNQYLNYLLPEIQQRLQTTDPQSNFAGRLAEVGGAPTNVPNIPIVQAYTPGQVQGRTNQFFAEGAQQAATAARNNAQSAAGRGFATTSPLLAELNQAAAGRAYRTANENALNFELGAADRNANLALQSWLGRLSASQVQSNDEIRRRQLALGQQGYDVQRESALLNALNVNLRPLSYSQSQSAQLGANSNVSDSVSTYVVDG